MIEDVVIIGSGPAGYSAAIYAARANLSPLIISGPEPGGQLTTTTIIENYPGFSDGVDAYELIMAWKQQALNFGARTLDNIVVDIFLDSDIKTIYLDNGKYIDTKTVIIATGASAKWLGIEGEQQYKNKGVSACATCDGYAFRGKDVAVIGGGDTAFEEALYLSKMCRKVYLIHRREEFRASKIMVDRATYAENIYFILNAVPQAFVGDGNKLNSILYKWNRDQECEGIEINLKVDGAFVAIGHIPNTSFLGESVLKDDSGYLETTLLNAGNTTFTTCLMSPDGDIIDGVYAAGDCADRVYRQAVTAAGEGCKAALDAERYLSTFK
jgi:thioredoxin-disulfide reductase